ncbi:iron-binding protein [Parasedimentitalea marina]|uniref:Iron-binding protein n=1 Tax=Parasedimentitalea marina TaxID=2483033 RepID=A0A3T0N788_9RHOB|nr:CDGSH iron-sulfur domain-containing protein [Parasedimentitalea marina]AZV79900.1 iron-binding protein [Parasedimentitalea marina]
MSNSENENITVHFHGKKCVHARRCVLGLPDVFQPGAKGGWISPDNANADDIAQVIDSCPSGALTYERKDGGKGETQPKVNTLRLNENGPNEIKGDIQIPNEEPYTRVLLCRCGKSNNMPFCDNSHLSTDFVASGEVQTTQSADTPTTRDGSLLVTPIKDGPVMVSGNLEIIAGSGRRIATGEKFVLCRCGASKNKPFCDGQHKKTGFETG